MKNDVVKNNLLDVLLDEDNCDPIVMLGENGQKLEFEQVAVIPYEDEIYCILKPITKINGVADNEGIVFRVVEKDDGETILMVEEDMEVAIAIFQSYYDMIENKE